MHKEAVEDLVLESESVSLDSSQSLFHQLLQLLH